MSQRRGAVLIIVVVIVMIVSLAAYHFTTSMEAEHLATRNAGDQISGRQSALSGVELVAAIVQQPRQDRDRLFAVARDPIDLWPSESEQEIPYRVMIAFPGADSMSNWIDESAKLNLHQLLAWDQTTPGLARDSLMRLPQMDESTADRLLDWIDSDSDARLQGDEQGARNSVPLLVDELAFLHEKRSDDALQMQTTDSQQPAWLSHLTVHSAERNESFDGRPRVFLNTADLIDLHRQLSEVLSPQIADYIILFRQYGASDDPAAAPDGAATADQPPPLDLSLPASVAIKDLSELIDSSVSLPPEQEASEDQDPAAPKTIFSPIQLGDQGGGGPPIDEILDHLTLTPETRLVGRVNVLTAPPEVLAAVPGMDQATAEQITRSRGNSERSFRHPIGLLSSLALDSTIVKQVMPHLTVAGDVVRAEFIGLITPAPSPQSQVDRPTYRCEVIIDASDGRARQAVFRQPSRAASLSDFEVDPTPTPTFDAP